MRQARGERNERHVPHEQFLRAPGGEDIDVLLDQVVLNLVVRGPVECFFDVCQLLRFCA
jgi:hypothetical protein